MLFCARLETGLAADAPLACAAFPQPLLLGFAPEQPQPGPAVFFVGTMLCAGRISPVCCHHQE